VLGWAYADHRAIQLRLADFYLEDILGDPRVGLTEHADDLIELVAALELI